MKKIAAVALLGTLAVSQFAHAAADEVNVYSYRQPFLVEPMFEEFTKETGIKVKVLFAKKGLAEKLQQEGKLSPADVILTTDISRLVALTEKGLVQPLTSKVINANVPPQFRDSDNEWFALTLRARNVYSSKDRVGALPASFDYLDLADPKWKGKICMRSGKHPYNVSLISSMIAHYGEAETKKWLEGVKANLAQKPQGNDRAQVKGIKDGLCDLAVGNSYYYGKMLADPKQKAWAESAVINFPGAEKNGTHVNVSGMSLAKYAPNKENAVKLMEFLTTDKAQKLYADVNTEYPVKAGVKPSAVVASWGDYRADDLPLDKVAEFHETAVKLLDEVKFDL